uniref:Protein BRAWNIN n=1 Tax=Cebus imitator TaxID=2715852 RepID=A0A2K5Q9X3_CEBIM
MRYYYTPPAGMPMSTYLKMLAASLLAMCAGTEVVHRYYQLDLPIPEISPKPGELKTELLELKERKHKTQVSHQKELK